MATETISNNNLLVSNYNNKIDNLEVSAIKDKPNNEYKEREFVSLGIEVESCDSYQPQLTQVPPLSMTSIKQVENKLNNSDGFMKIDYRRNASGDGVVNLTALILEMLNKTIGYTFTAALKNNKVSTIGAAQTLVNQRKIAENKQKTAEIFAATSITAAAAAMTAAIIQTASSTFSDINGLANSAANIKANALDEIKKKDLEKVSFKDSAVADDKLDINDVKLRDGVNLTSENIAFYSDDTKNRSVDLADKNNPYKLKVDDFKTGNPPKDKSILIFTDKDQKQTAYYLDKREPNTTVRLIDWTPEGHKAMPKDKLFKIGGATYFNEKSINTNAKLEGINDASFKDADNYNKFIKGEPALKLDQTVTINNTQVEQLIKGDEILVTKKGTNDKIMLKLEKADKERLAKERDLNMNANHEGIDFNIYAEAKMEEGKHYYSDTKTDNNIYYLEDKKPAVLSNAKDQFIKYLAETPQPIPEENQFTNKDIIVVDTKVFDPKKSPNGYESYNEVLTKSLKTHINNNENTLERVLYNKPLEDKDRKMPQTLDPLLTKTKTKYLILPKADKDGNKDTSSNPNYVVIDLENFEAYGLEKEMQTSATAVKEWFSDGVKDLNYDTQQAIKELLRKDGAFTTIPPSTEGGKETIGVETTHLFKDHYEVMNTVSQKKEAKYIASSELTEAYNTPMWKNLNTARAEFDNKEKIYLKHKIDLKSLPHDLLRDNGELIEQYHQLTEDNQQLTAKALLQKRGLLPNNFDGLPPIEQQAAYAKIVNHYNNGIKDANNIKKEFMASAEKFKKAQDEFAAKGDLQRYQLEYEKFLHKNLKDDELTNIPTKLTKAGIKITEADKKINEANTAIAKAEADIKTQNETIINPANIKITNIDKEITIKQAKLDVLNAEQEAIKQQNQIESTQELRLKITNFDNNIMNAKTELNQLKLNKSQIEASKNAVDKTFEESKTKAEADKKASETEKLNAMAEKLTLTGEESILKDHIASMKDILSPGKLPIEFNKYKVPSRPDAPTTAADYQEKIKALTKANEGNVLKTLFQHDTDTFNKHFGHSLKKQSDANRRYWAKAFTAFSGLAAAGHAGNYGAGVETNLEKTRDIEARQASEKANAIIHLDEVLTEETNKVNDGLNRINSQLQEAASAAIRNLQGTMGNQ